MENKGRREDSVSLRQISGECRGQAACENDPLDRDRRSRHEGRSRADEDTEGHKLYSTVPEAK